MVWELGRQRKERRASALSDFESFLYSRGHSTLTLYTRVTSRSVITHCSRAAM